MGVIKGALWGGAENTCVAGRVEVRRIGELCNDPGGRWGVRDKDGGM